MRLSTRATARPKVVIFLFYPRFIAPIRAGTKRQTVRRTRTHPPVRPGDLASLRHWLSVPYRSPQAMILPAVPVTYVGPILIEVAPRSGPPRVEISGVMLSAADVEAFARRDGFASAAELARYYRHGGVDRLDGQLITWAFPGTGTEGGDS